MKNRFILHGHVFVMFVSQFWSCISFKVTGHFVTRSFRNQSFRTILVISYPLFGHFVPSNSHFVPRSFRTHFGHFVTSATGYEITFETQFVLKLFRTYFVPRKCTYQVYIFVSILYLFAYFVICFLLTDMTRYVTISSPWLGAQQRVALYLRFFLLDIENTKQTG